MVLKSLKTRKVSNILHKGYRYRIDYKNADGSTAWRCMTTGCKGRLKVFNADVEERNIHNHSKIY